MRFRERLLSLALVLTFTLPGCALPRQTPVTNVVMSNVFRDRTDARRADNSQDRPARQESLYRRYIVKPMVKMTVALALLPTTLKADRAIERASDTSSTTR